MSNQWMRAKAVDHQQVQAGERTYKLQSVPECIEPLAALRAYLCAFALPVVVDLDVFTDESGRFYGTAPDAEQITQDLLARFHGYYTSTALSEPIAEAPSLTLLDFFSQSPETLAEHYKAFAADGVDQAQFIQRIRYFQHDPLQALEPFDSRFINLCTHVRGVHYCATLSESADTGSLGYSSAQCRVVFTPKDSVFEAPREARQVILLPGLFNDTMPRPDLEGISVYSVTVNSAAGTADIGTEQDASADGTTFKVIVDEEGLDEQALWYLVQGVTGIDSLVVTFNGQVIEAGGGAEPEAPAEAHWTRGTLNGHKSVRDADQQEYRLLAPDFFEVSDYLFGLLTKEPVPKFPGLESELTGTPALRDNSAISQFVQDRYGYTLSPTKFDEVIKDHSKWPDYFWQETGSLARLDSTLDAARYDKLLGLFQRHPEMVMNAYDSRFTNLRVGEHCASLRAEESTLGYASPGRVVFRKGSKKTVAQPVSRMAQVKAAAVPAYTVHDITMVPGLVSDGMPFPELAGIEVWSVALNANKTQAVVGALAPNISAFPTQFSIIVDTLRDSAKDLYLLVNAAAGTQNVEITLHGSPLINDAALLTTSIETPPASTTLPTTDEPESGAPNHSLFGFKLATDDAARVPDMTGFEPEYLGLPDVGWGSPGYIRGDRDLAKDETLYAYLIREADGSIAETVAYTPAVDAKLPLAAWPKDFAYTISSKGKHLKAGNWNNLGAFTSLEGSGVNRLWHFSNRYRAFTTAPGKNNWVQAVALDSSLKGMPENSGKLRIQVCDIATQRVYESLRFDVPVSSTGIAQWNVQLCTKINSESKFIRAGRQGSDGRIEPSAVKENALWIPQCSDLAVTVMDVTGWSEENINYDFAEHNVGVEAISWTPAATSKVGERIFVTGGRSVASGEMHLKVYYKDMASAGGAFVLRLPNEAIAKGIRFAGCTHAGKRLDGALLIKQEAHSITFVATGKDAGNMAIPGVSEYFIDMYVPRGVHNFSYEVFAGRTGPGGVWDKVRTFKKSTPGADTSFYKPLSHLCEDFGNTVGSEVFDVSGQVDNGVDPRTGLFHAHYPVASLTGLNGQGPVCDLTLHYSPLRGNEAGLGDGWAFRFSSFENRDRLLRLASGETLVLTKEEWEALAKEKPLKKSVCWITSNKTRDTLTLDYPNGQREVLTVPKGDSKEPNDALRTKIIKLLQNIKDKNYPVIDLKKEVGSNSWGGKHSHGAAAKCLQCSPGSGFSRSS